ncbi:hypothetical protein ACEPPN_002891 [Leptodophora sp. 'Broadleaf-Isolate-01']
MDQPHRDPGQIGYRAYNNYQRNNCFVDRSFIERANSKENKKYAKNNEHHQKMLAAIHANEEGPEANAFFYNLYGFPGIPRRGEGTVIRRRDGALPPRRNLPCHDQQKAANKNRPYEKIVPLWGENDFPALPTPTLRQQVSTTKNRVQNPVVTLEAEKKQVAELSKQAKAPLAAEDNQVAHTMENGDAPIEEGKDGMVPQLVNTLFLFRSETT